MAKPTPRPGSRGPSRAKSRKPRPAGFTGDLATLLDTIDRPGEFAVGGRRITPMPHLVVDGIGTIALPLLPIQAQSLIALAERAPYGRGADTLVDATVRRCWQLAPDLLASAPLERQRVWKKTLAKLVRRACRGLGVEGEVHAELYKVLVYEAGDFFVEHRDTEKVAGMFATLVVSLPSVHTGGALVVEHAGSELGFDLRVAVPSRVAWAAFYADCVHRLEPIASGYRLALVYNLVRHSRGPRPKPPDRREAVKALTGFLQKWSRAPAAASSPEKLIAILDHHYTPAGLSFGSLKNRDAATVAALTQAAADAKCVCHLAMVSISESGSADGLGDYDSEDDYDVIEVDDRRQQLDGWIAPPGRTCVLDASIPFHLSEVSPPGAIDEEAPDEQHFTEATGNEGGSFERTYRRAGLVIWPRARELKIIAHSGAPVALPYLAKLLDDAASEAIAEGFARDVIAHWRNAHALGYAFDPEAMDASAADVASMLKALGRLKDPELLATFAATGALAQGQLEALLVVLLDAVENTGWSAAAGWLMLLVEHELEAGRRWRHDRFDSAARLLAAIIRHTQTTHPTIATLAAQTATAALTSGLLPGPAVFADLLTAIAQGVPDHVEQLVARTLDPVATPPDTLIAIACALDQPPSALASVRATAIVHLEARVSQSLSPPASWTRQTVGLTCKCSNCKAVMEFLGDPRAPSWQLRANEESRKHVERKLADADSDVRCETLRTTRPLTLVVHKTLKSHERRVARRATDLRNLDLLRGRPAPTKR